MVIMRKNMEFITSGQSDTINTSDILKYFLTAMHDSHSLISNMIQQFKKIHIECMIEKKTLT